MQAYTIMDAVGLHGSDRDRTIVSNVTFAGHSTEDWIVLGGTRQDGVCATLGSLSLE